MSGHDNPTNAAAAAAQAPVSYFILPAPSAASSSAPSPPAHGQLYTAATHTYFIPGAAPPPPAPVFDAAPVYYHPGPQPAHHHPTHAWFPSPPPTAMPPGVPPGHVMFAAMPPPSHFVGNAPSAGLPPLASSSDAGGGSGSSSSQPSQRMYHHHPSGVRTTHHLTTAGSQHPPMAHVMHHAPPHSHHGGPHPGSGMHHQPPSSPQPSAASSWVMVPSQSFHPHHHTGYHAISHPHATFVDHHHAQPPPFVFSSHPQHLSGSVMGEGGGGGGNPVAAMDANSNSGMPSSSSLVVPPTTPPGVHPGPASSGAGFRPAAGGSVGPTTSETKAPVASQRLPGPFEDASEDEIRLGRILISEMRREKVDAVVATRLSQLPSSQLNAVRCALDSDPDAVLQLCDRERGKIVCTLLEKYGTENCVGIVRVLSRNFCAMALSQSGCIALPRVMASLTPAEIDPFVDVCVANLSRLACDRYANYVVKHFTSWATQRDDVMERFAQTFARIPDVVTRVAADKYGSFVMDDFLKTSSYHAMQILIQRLFLQNPADVRALCGDAHGNYVVQAALENVRRHAQMIPPQDVLRIARLAASESVHSPYFSRIAAHLSALERSHGHITVE